jgi:arginase
MASEKNKRAVHIIGVPLDLGGNRRGTDMGPSAFRIAGLAERIAQLGITVGDKGDVSSPIPEKKGSGDPRKKYVKDIQRVCHRLYQTALASFADGAMPIVLGGDHSLGAGSVAAAATHVRKSGKPLGLIWVDAHADMNNPASSESGNVHGMPLAALLGAEPAELHVAPFSPAVLARHTVLVGVRNLDEVEKQIVRAAKVHVFTMKDIDTLGITEVMARAIALAGKGTGGFHVSYDLDVCDPTVAPGVGTPVRGGLSYREAHVVMEMVAESGKMTSFDLVEVNPTLDIRNTTAELGTELALSALGKSIL